MKRLLPFIIILAVLGIALAGGLYLTRPVPSSSTAAGQPSAAAASQASQSQPARQGVAGAEPAHVKGPAKATAHIEEFGDFQCPPCGLFHSILKQMETEFGDELRVTFRHFPLPNHSHALVAASAAEAAGMQNKFWQMHAMIYEHQLDWKDLPDARPTFESYAKEIGLDMERFKRDLISDAVAQRIAQDTRRAHSLGVNATPTVFLNGRELPFNSLPADSLRVLIQQEINKK